jgi:hypothetical protein
VRFVENTPAGAVPTGKEKDGHRQLHGRFLFVVLEEADLKSVERDIRQPK